MTRTSTVLAAVLCLGVAAVHIDDQGGIAALADPDWIGWAYRLLEVVAVGTAGWLVFAAGASWSARRARPAWVLALLVGLGPLVGYILTRTTGLPGSSDDIGHWGEPAGVASLIIEAALILLTAGLALSGENRVHVHRTAVA